MSKDRKKVVKTPGIEKEDKLVWDKYDKTNPYKIFTYTDPIPDDKKQKK